jgi:dihydrofolate reductase
MSDRKVVLKLVLSLDGFATSPDGTHEWMFRYFSDDSNAWSLRALEQAGVHAMGRRSYEIMGPHWAARTGLVDEYQLMTVPIVVGQGRSPFAQLERHLELELIEERRFAGGALGQVFMPTR